MYASSSCPGNAGGIDTLVASYSPALSLDSAVQEAYSCEGCRKLMDRMYEKAEVASIEHHSPAPLLRRGSYGVGSYTMDKRYGLSVNGAMAYTGNQGESAGYTGVSRTYDSAPAVFLNPIRPETAFIDNESQILELAGEAFLQLTGRQLPKDISISICTKEELRQRHGNFGAWSDGIRGFAINGREKRVFVKQDHLDALMMVLGHEIGHVFTPTLGNRHDEEAKAFSFAEAWASCIKTHNIGNLAACIKGEQDWQPAANGLHDVAFHFVRSLLGKGMHPMQVHWDLAKGYKSLFNAYI